MTEFSRAARSLRRQELESYRITDAINALAAGKPAAAGFAFEFSEDLARGREVHSSNSLLVPAWALLTQRDLTAAAGSAGGYLVSTENDRAGVLELLRGRSVIVDAGATILSGLVGNVSIPRETAEATGYWLPTESTAATPAQPTLGSVALSPKSVVALSKLSRQLAIQSSPSAVDFLKLTLRKSLAMALDGAAIAGNGASGVPLGVVNTAGIGSVTGTTLGLAGVLEFQSDCGNSLSDRCAYFTTRAVADVLARRAALGSGTERALWTGNLHRGELGGFPGMTSPNVPAGGLIFGAWDNLLVGEWGEAIELSVDPFTGFTTGSISVRAWLTCDVAVLRPPAFSFASSVT